MRNFTKIVLSLVMAFGLLGGVNSVKATKTYWAPSTAIATWNSETKTMTWTAGDENGWHMMNSGLPTGDLSAAGYTKLHIEITSITNNINNPYITVKIASTGKADQYLPIYVGVNNIAFADYSTDIDFSKVTEISFWGSGDEGSAVITDCYLYGPVKTITVATGFGTEITQLSDITDGTRFVIGDGTNAMYFTTGDNARNSLSAAVTNVPNDSYYYYTLTNAGLDLDGINGIDDDLFIVSIVNEAGTAFPNQWGWPNKLNISQYNGGDIFSGTADSPNYGQDYRYGAVWKVAYEEGKGFTFKNMSSELGNYMKVASSQAETCYLKLYQSITFASSTDLEKENNASNDVIFALANADGYNAETGEMTNGTWTFDTPVDLTDWDYLMITTSNTAADASHEITIKDNDGVTVKGEDYSGSTAGTGGNMWLDRWNNQNAIRISLDYLRRNKSMDISQIKSLRINGTVKVANVYLTDYNNTKINGGYCTGDVVREYAAIDKFGTICLPYKASCAGAEIYEIAGKTANGVTLTKVTGLLEAGKPYFYVSSDEIGKDNAGAVRNVNFFRADADTYDAASAGTNNGLIGTFSEITAPIGDDYYVLSNNKLYNVDSSVTVGANKAYVNKSAITPSLARGFVDLDFNEPTGIETIANSQELNANSKFFNLAGQRVAQPTKGLYIVNGKKVLVK